ncbi:MAG: SDR family NAD(P)-dependent oxidoreductase [Actinobacteria bacterium]|nr:SDR family NAD(P)-dependent oxidoreductase [Actinomycetota bacterium]
MGLFDGKVAIVTGAGRGIGREEALLLAKEGASVVVNDLGGARTGEGSDVGPAQQVVDEIVAAGGQAVANTNDCSSWSGAEEMVNQAIETFGSLDVLVNNAGILRDKMSFNMTEEEWDSVIKVHLKGHFAPARFAAAYWRQKGKDTGESVNAKIVNTASESGLYANAGQANYAAAKAGIASMTIVLARELERFGVRVNCIAPVALTRLTEDLMGQGNEEMAAKLAPANIAAGVCWLASDLSEGVNGQVLKIQGGLAQIVQGWRPITQITSDEAWTIEAIDAGRDTLFSKSDPGIPPFFLNINDPTA